MTNKITEVSINLPIESHTNFVSKPNKHYCVECNEENKKETIATIWCENCKEFYCDFHSNLVHKLKALKKHSLINIGESFDSNLNPKKTICKIHNEKYELFCLTDQKFLCYKCIIPEHNGHNIQLISKYNKSWELNNHNIQLTNEDIKNLIASREKLFSKIAKENNNLNKQQQKMIDLVDLGFEKIQKELKTKVEQIKNDIKKEKKQQRENLNKQYRNIKQHISNLVLYQKHLELLQVAKKRENQYAIINQKLKIENLQKGSNLVENLTIAKNIIIPHFDIGQQINSIKELKIENVNYFENARYDINSIIYTNKKETIYLHLNNENLEVKLSKIAIRCYLIDADNNVTILKNLIWKQTQNPQTYKAQFIMTEIGDYTFNLEINGFLLIEDKPIQARLPKSPSKILSFELFQHFLQYMPEAMEFHLRFEKNEDNNSFHETCIGKGKSFIVCKNDLGYVFGGYSDIGFGRTNRYERSQNSFLFYLGKDSESINILKLSGKDNRHENIATYEKPPNGSYDFHGKETNTNNEITSFECFCEF
ncbi:hypothetical protein M0813_01923 [Anaeramoeba flamelloides]|uniref:B box-type domain-containing protein n=1 Tax=Anaeramoeba flamelloides TaxID=1746091 RepID=A0ABQ8YQ29_9EUKA|nr:hypothetical protein M0813_01923 [Anaeramoeba flamelloides]